MSSRREVRPPQEPRKGSRGRIIATRLLALALMAMLLWPHPADAAAWYSNLWRYRKAITIDHIQVATTDQTNFPVLINLSDSDLSAHARDDGFDILFTSSDGLTKIPYEREKYASGALVAWVLVASLSHTSDTVLYMYYGNAGAADQQDITQAVWDASYVGVWHLKEATGAASADSASTNTATPLNSPAQTTGQIDGALTFNGTNMEDNVASTFSLGTASVTMEAWVNLGSASLHGAFIKIGGTSPNQGYAIGVGSTTFDDIGNVPMVLYEGVRWIPATGKTYGTGWHHAVLVIDASGHPIIYVDGINIFTDAIGAPAAPSSSITHIGGYTGAGSENRHFNGILDEVRISNIVRSADWLKTQYNNQSSPGTFYSVSVSVSSAWHNASWARRRPITIDHTKVSNTDQSSFPVLINLASDSGLSAHARSDGFDILFTSSDGITQIPYEREKYTSGTGALVAWVQVPALSHTADTLLYMYYGNPGASDQQQRTSVWDSNYKIVYHLGDAGPTTAADSTTNSNNGTQTGTVTFGAAGQIDGAAAYTGGKFISAASAPSISTTGSFTYETWVLVTSYTPNTNITSADGSYWIDRTTATNALVSLVPVGGLFGYQTRYDDGSALGGPVGGTIPASTVWTHIAMVRDFNTAFRLYVNGSQVATTSDTGSKALTPPTPKLGRHATSATQWLNGSLDEFRVSSVARSADWIKTEYNNESSPGTFSSVGGEQTFSAVGGGEQVRPRIQIM